MIKLKEVKLLKHDTCYTYVLKRIGEYSLDNLLITSEDFLKKFDRDRPQISDLNPGDILVYESNLDETNTFELARIITEDGVIIWRDVYTNLHFMVYEKDGLVSDACIEKDICLGIRMNRLYDISDKWKRLIPKQN